MRARPRGHPRPEPDSLPALGNEFSQRETGGLSLSGELGEQPKAYRALTSSLNVYLIFPIIIFGLQLWASVTSLIFLGDMTHHDEKTNKQTYTRTHIK